MKRFFLHFTSTTHAMASGLFLRPAVPQLIWLSAIVAVGLPGCQRPASSPARPAEPGGHENAAPAATTESASESATADQASTESAAEPVATLGSAELTSGIPGKGPLTADEIRAWLDDPANHAVLQVQLPLGLSAAEANITGLESNPMTRAKIELGRQLYFDSRLSVDGTISCASCHDPKEGYSRHTKVGVGVRDQEGNRNSPVAYNRILSGPQFWDGRANSLEDQAKGPIENPVEMANTHATCAASVNAIEGYRLQFDRIFPGEGVTIDTIAKAIATFERTLVTGPTPYDYLEIVTNVERSYAADEMEDLQEDDPELFEEYQRAKAALGSVPESVLRGSDLFFSERTNCTACHAGANFTDEQYHNLGVGMEQPEPDLGRSVVTKEEKDRGAFKTPTLRNVHTSAPYMHDGSQATLAEVVDWYVKGGHPNPFLSDKIKKLDLTDQERQDLIDFLTIGLAGEFPLVETERLPESSST